MAELSIVATIFATGMFVGWQTKAWSNPAVIFALFWGGISLAAVVVLPNHAGFLAIAYVAVAVLAFSMPSLVLLRHRPTVGDKLHSISHVKASQAVIITLAISLPVLASIFFVRHLWAQGLSLAAFIEDPARFGWHFVNLRYQGRVVNTASLQMGTVLNYAAAMLIGKTVANQKRFILPAVLIGLGALPSLLTMFLFGDKGTLFQSGAFFYGGLIIGWLSLGFTRLASRRSIVFGIGGALFMGALVAIALMIKIDGRLALDAQLLALVEQYALSYVLGSFYAFSDWLSFYLGQPSATGYTASPPLLGIQTFWGFAKYVFTTYQMPDGYYAEYFLIEGVLKTNIFTMFRGLIADFGLAGSIAFLAFAGMISALTYRALLQNPNSPIAQTIVIAIVGFIYSSYLISLATWTTPFAAAALFGAIVSLESVVNSWGHPRERA